MPKEKNFEVDINKKANKIVKDLIKDNAKFLCLKLCLKDGREVILVGKEPKTKEIINFLIFKIKSTKGRGKSKSPVLIDEKLLPKKDLKKFKRRLEDFFKDG